MSDVSDFRGDMTQMESSVTQLKVASDLKVTDAVKL